MVIEVDIVDGSGGPNSWFDKHYKEQVESREELKIATLIQTALQIVQLIAYYNLADNAIDQRDDEIDKEISFMQELEDYKETQDLPMLNLKKSVLTDLGLPTVDMCSDVILYTDDAANDGQAVDNKSLSFVDETCEGMPQGWSLHEGSLMGAKSGAYAGGAMANNALRRQEKFRANKTRLVRAGQQGMKAMYSANETLSKYAQAATIHSGLADLFIQGFNSAGAGLGVLLGRLSQGNGTTNDNSAGSNTNVGNTTPDFNPGVNG